MLNWMIWTKYDLEVSHKKQVNESLNKKLVKSLMNIECQPCGIFGGLSYHQEGEAIDTTIFAATIGLGYRIKKLVSSNFMGIVSSVSSIFDTGVTYSCSSNKVDFVKLEENPPPRNLKYIAKYLDISGFGIVKYSARSESGHMISLRAQEYYAPGLPKYLRIISPQGICTSEGYKGTFIAHCHYEHDIYVELNLKRAIQVGRRMNLLRGFTSSMNQITTFQIMKLLYLTREIRGSRYWQVMPVSLTR